ncbi:MAG TPA: hypothetical protein VHC22_15795 [Pirellulales bacterium]|nr:hypothetical protein [Pirellulales bacterium]
MTSPMTRRIRFGFQSMKTWLLAAAICAAVICVAIAGCDKRSSRTTSDAEWYAGHRKQTDAQMEQIDRQIRRATTQQDLQAEQNERFDKLLDRWEKQADRQEAILDAQEKQLGIEK